MGSYGEFIQINCTLNTLFSRTVHFLCVHLQVNFVTFKSVTYLKVIIDRGQVFKQYTHFKRPHLLSQPSMVLVFYASVQHLRQNCNLFNKVYLIGNINVLRRYYYSVGYLSLMEPTLGRTGPEEAALPPYLHNLIKAPQFYQKRFEQFYLYIRVCNSAHKKVRI